MTEHLIEVLQRTYTKGPFKAIRPVDAASILLIDRRDGVAKVLMGKRNEAAKFMPGVFVFPGGRVEAEDAGVPHAGELQPADVQRMTKLVQRPTERRLKGLALAAIRETFEETGLRLGARAAEPVSVTAKHPWHDFFATGDIPTLDGLRFLGRAITPPGRNRRFDTRFFVRDVSDVPNHDMIRPTPESELVELVWVPLTDTEKLSLVEITQMILGSLKTLEAAGFDEAAPRPLYRMRHGRFERVHI